MGFFLDSRITVSSGQKAKISHWNYCKVKYRIDNNTIDK